MTYQIITLGCKVNTYESNFIRENLTKLGYQEVLTNPEWIIINSCAVTNNAEQKTEKVINRFTKNMDVKIALMGCYSQLYFNELSKNEKIKVLIGNSGKSKLADYITLFDNQATVTRYVDDLTSTDFEDMMISDFKGRKRAFVKIQDGCDNFCSYCIIPTTRGSVRSKKIEHIILEINELVRNGYQEVVLTGIHTGKYCDGENNFLVLLKSIIEHTKLVRCRISSIEINELTDEIIDLLTDPRFARHLHIPLQSGSDEVLKLMNRKYNTREFEERINYIKDKIPGIAITTDLIVGHPGESEQLFTHTASFVKKLEFATVHVFPYAKRQGTPSALMDNGVPDDIKKARVHKILDLNTQLVEEYQNQFVNQVVSVLIEKQVANQYFGHSSEYLPVLVNAEYDIVNKLIDVKINHRTNHQLVGEILD